MATVKTQFERIFNATSRAWLLKFHNVTTLEGALALSDKDLLSMAGVGKKAVWRLRNLQPQTESELASAIRDRMASVKDHIKAINKDLDQIATLLNRLS